MKKAQMIELALGRAHCGITNSTTQEGHRQSDGYPFPTSTSKQRTRP